MTDSLIDITDHGELYVACKPVSVHWRDLGARLGVLQNTLATIEADCNGKVEKCMSAMLEKWLRRPFGEVRDDIKPTWKRLCVALSHIDRPLAERLAEEHDCGDISVPASDVAQLSDAISQPAFLPQICGCGKCTIIGWRTGDSCQLARYSEYPKLLVVHPKHSSASFFKQSYDKHASLCQATSHIAETFQTVVSDIWDELFECVKKSKVDLAKIVRTLRAGLGIELPMFTNLDSLQNHCHSLRVSWYNFRPLHLLVVRVLANLSPTLLADWNSYLTSFKEYCSARNLKDYSDVFFRVEEHNIFLLEIDECYYNFTLSDIEGLCNSLSIAVGCPSVHLHLVTVRRGSLIIYLYYSYSDYLTVFQSLTTEQLKMISQIKAYWILSLTDLHNQFRYDKIQSYAEASPQKNTSKSNPKIDVFESTFQESTTDELYQGSSLIEGTELWRKQSQMKDVELSVACTELKRNKELIISLQGQLHSMKELNIFSSKEIADLTARLDSSLQSLTLKSLKEVRGKPMKTITGLIGPRDLAVSDNGDIIVAEWSAHCVTIVNKEGKKVKLFGTRGTKEGQFEHPRGVAITNDKHILVTDEHRLQKLTFDGVCVQSVGSSKSVSGQLQFDHPRGIAVHLTTGLVFVADSWNNRIRVFNSDLTYAHSITLHGDNQLKWFNTDEQFNRPYDVSLDSDGCVYIAEWGNHCITKLTTAGEFITRFCSKGSAPGQLFFPSSLTINNNLVYVCEEGNDRVSVFDTKGTFLHCFGKRGSGEGEFNSPIGITTDTFGNLYVSDFGNNRLVVY